MSGNKLLQLQRSMEAHDDLSWLSPGRKLVLEYTPPQVAPPPSVSAELNESSLERPCTSALGRTPKYTATVIDAFPQHDRPFKHISTVFIIPQGMELDWLVSTPEGQAQVVAGADAARVFLVTLNRGHAFSRAEQVQKELSPWIRSLTPTQGLPPTLSASFIPYTTTPQGIGHRTVLIEAWSDINGAIVVEDVRLIEPGRLQPTTFRRMVFLESPGLIQSEAVLIHTEPGENLGQEEAGVAREQCQETRDGPGVSEFVMGTILDGGANTDRNAAGVEEVERDHRKKTRRRGVASSPSTKEAEDLKDALGEELAMESDRERGHRKRARRRRGQCPASVETGGKHQGYEPDVPKEGFDFCDGLSPSGRYASEQSGTVADAESQKHARCPEDAGGVNASGAGGVNESQGASALHELPATSTTNEGGEFLGPTSAGLAVNWNGAGRAGVKSRDSPETANAGGDFLGPISAGLAVNRNGARGAGVKSRDSPGLTGVDFSYLASDYLQATVAALAFLGPGIEERTAAGRLLDVLVIGLGGGGMPMLLRRHLPCRVEVIEIDPTVVQLATAFFGVSQDAAFQVHIADAIPWVVAAAAADEAPSKSRTGSFDAVLIDVESAGGQCPPPGFWEPRFLSSLRKLLRPNGVFAMNVVASEKTREAIYGAIRKFLGGQLHEWSVPQNSNRVLISHRATGFGSADVSQTSAECNLVDELLMGAENGHVSSECVPQTDDAVDLVYWASRLVEKGAGMTSWARGPDLPSLVGDIHCL